MVQDTEQEEHAQRQPKIDKRLHILGKKKQILDLLYMVHQQRVYVINLLALIKKNLERLKM